MGALYVRAMDKLYWACIAIGVVSLVAMTGLIATGVFMRYLFNLGAQFAERHRVLVTFDSANNLGLCGDFQSLDGLGIRYGFLF